MTIDRLLRILSLRMRSLLQRNVVEQELDEELLYHIEKQTELNIRQGMTPGDARAAALRAFGNVDRQKEEVRDTRGLRVLEELPRDFAFSVRSLSRAKGFAIAVILTLALGIGANTAMFTILRGTLLRPLPNRDGSQLLYLRQSADATQQANVLFSVPEVADFRVASHAIQEFAEFSSSIPFTLIDSSGTSARVQVGIISGNYFHVLGLEPIIGRLINVGDDGPAAQPVAVLAHQYWIDKFGGDSLVVGRTVRLNDRLTMIVGVLQPAPSYPRRTEVFVNTVISPHHLSATMVTNRKHRMTELFARLAPGKTVDDARREIGEIGDRMRHDHPEAYEKAAQYRIALLPLREAVNERASRTFWLLMGAAGFVLLIACANVANLTLMRGVGREREMLVRAALGAGTARLRRLLLVENLTLVVVAGALGVLVAYAGLGMLRAFAAQLSPRADEIRMDGVVLVAGLTISVIAAIALSFIPRLGGTGALAAPLGPAGRRITLGRGRQRFQRFLVVAQVAVCMVLLSGAGLLARTLEKLNSVETGVRAEKALTIEMPLDGDLLREVMKQAENLARYERVRERVAALPGVQLASLGSGTPLRSTVVDFDVKAEGVQFDAKQPTPHALFKSVDPRYFEAAGIPVRKGRAFDATDRVGSERVVVLNESFARRLFGDRDPIGRRVAWTGEVLQFTPVSGEWRTVVGVVGDTRDQGLENDATPTMYLPFAQEVIFSAVMIIRTKGDPALLQPSIIRAIREASPHQLIARVATLEQIRDESVAPRRLNAAFIASFGVLAFVIAMVGIASVLGFSVSSRIGEIGIRMSFGADSGRVQRMILGEGGVLILLGLAAGLTGALFATRLLRGLLFGISPQDPLTLVAVTLTLGAVGVGACWLPAAKASRVDPAVALRAE